MRRSALAAIVIAVIAREHAAARTPARARPPRSRRPTAPTRCSKGSPTTSPSRGFAGARVEADTAYFYESTQVTELRNVKVRSTTSEARKGRR